MWILYINYHTKGFVIITQVVATARKRVGKLAIRTGADELTIWYICKDIAQVRLRIKNQFSRAALLIDNKIYTVKLYEIFKEKNKIDLVYVGTVR